MRILVFLIAIALVSSCKDQTKQQTTEQTNDMLPIIGTWELISATTIQGDSTYQKDLSNKRMIKIINDSHFAFLNHDLNKGEDSLAVFVAGGGSYTLAGDTYTEVLEYCNFRKWENNTFEFNVKVKGDTLIQSGIEEIKELGVDRKIIEVYIKTEK